MDFDDEPLPAVRESAMRSGDFLWRPGDAFSGPVIVHSGCVMIYRVSPAGEEQVLQFALPGDLIGLEALASGHHDVHARALGEVLCCRIPCSSTGSAADAPGLSRRLLWRASNILAREHHRMRHDDPTSSVLDFLRDVGQRLGREEGDGDARNLQVRLPMSRLEIGRYLGFAEETVCRAIRRLEEQGVIEARGRHVSLLEPARNAS
ncbi:MAG: Crp/Fnr family transcriptional regulator [Steroidobacteraceae bacterium]